MLRRALRAAAAAAFVAAPLVLAAPAVADESECADSPYVKGGYMMFDVEEKYVPPPMRGTAWDCAIRIADHPLDDDYRTDNNYALIYVGITYDELVSILRGFEEMGYARGNEVNIIDRQDGTAFSKGAALGADGLAAMDPQPKFVGARFSNAVGGQNIYELAYADGTLFRNPAGLGAIPTLYASIILTEPFAEQTAVPLRTGTTIRDPSVLSSLRSIGEAAPDATQTTVIAGTSVVLMLLVGFPGALLDAVVGDRYDQVVQRWRTRRRSKRDPEAPARRAPGWLIWPGFVAAAAIGGFVDPGYGLNGMSARLLLTAFLGFALLNLAGWTLVRRAVSRVEPEARQSEITFRWGSLVLVAVTVAMARLLHFEPGVIFGLVAGLAFGMALVASRDALVVLLGSGFALVIALVGWLGYSLLAPVVDSHPGNVPLLFGSEFFSGVTVQGISTLPVTLLPLLALDGAALFAWKKWVWAAGYAVGLAAFMLVLFTIPDAWGEVNGSFVRWVLIFVAFAVLSVGVWVANYLLERRRGSAVTEHAPATVEPSTD